jgi:hypothetical protein
MGALSISLSVEERMKTLACCILLFGLGLVSFAVLPTKANGPSGYHVAKKVVLGGEGGWDYLTADSDGRRVYLSRGTHVMVIDADTGAVVGDIPNTNGWNCARAWPR